MHIFSIIIIILLVFLTIFMYLRTSKILRQLDSMLDSAIDNTFSENNFTEENLSRIEAKMYRYLSAGKTARNQVIAERNAVKALVSDISHQTKTPLSNILLYTQLLEEAPDLSDNTRNIVSNIGEQTEKLNFLIRSLIKTSRLENGIVTVIPKENSVRKLIENMDFTIPAQNKDINLLIEDIPDVKACFDLKWTSEALSNIMDNAIKYTQQGGSVTVSAKEYEMFVRIDVADTGIGISEDETAKIFTRFYRSPAVSGEKGVGIGLYLAREIVTRDGGYIKVSSRPGKGSVFSVFLPKTSNLS